MHKCVPKWETEGKYQMLLLLFKERTIRIFLLTWKTLFVDLPKRVLTDPEKAFARINIAMKQDIAIADREQYWLTIFIKRAEIISATFFMRIFTTLTFDVDGITPVSTCDV